MKVNEHTSREDLLEYIKTLEFNVSRLIVDANRSSLRTSISKGNRYIRFHLISPYRVPYSSTVEHYSRLVDTIDIDLHEHF